MELVQRRMTRPEDAERELSLMLEDGRYRNEAAVRYAIARAQLRAKRPDQAAAGLDRLLGTHPDMVEFVVSRADADRQLGRDNAAFARLEGALQDNPTSYALNIAYAEAALAAGKPALAEKKLTKFRSFRPDDPRVYQLLSRAAGDQDKRSTGHAFLADYYYLIGELEAAILQLDIALDQPNLDFYASSKLESRRAALQREKEVQEDRRSAKR
jgi:predicted Zn-dependent protease